MKINAVNAISRYTGKLAYNGTQINTVAMEKIDQILDSLYDRVIEPMEAKQRLLDLFAVINWVAFDFHKVETRPPKYGKYLIARKDGKIHLETWNCSGWAYNHNEIRYWAEIKPPCL